MASNKINPQGYEFGLQPKNINPFWGGDGGTGYTFTPVLTPIIEDEEEKGYKLSWENDGGLENPDPVNLYNGEKGARGDKGDKGDKGDNGEQGEQGIQGIQGEKGDKGDKGDTGAQGIQGIQGIQGEKGEKGDKGDTGAQGEQGEKGEKGDKGDTGATGATGATPVITATASVDSTTGTPAVTVTKTGDPETPNINFSFTGLKGADGTNGANGADGVTPVVSATASVDANTGTPAVSVTKSGSDANPVFNFAFSGLKGEQGQGSTETFSTYTGTTPVTDLFNDTSVTDIVIKQTGTQVLLTDARYKPSFYCLYNGSWVSVHEDLPSASPVFTSEQNLYIEVKKRNYGRDIIWNSSRIYNTINDATYGLITIVYKISRVTTGGQIIYANLTPDYVIGKINPCVIIEQTSEIWAKINPENVSIYYK